MSHMKNLTGVRFGKLVALEPTNRRLCSYIVWHCRCDCGADTLVISSNLLSGKTNSCGCGRGSRIDITGQRFGRLMVIEFIGKNKQNQNLWRCICDCGNEHFATTGNLLIKNVSSCGCLALELCKKMGLATRNPNITDEERLKNRGLTKENIEFKKEVYKSDDYTCQVCGQRGGKLNAHHLYAYRAFPVLRFDISNGITLCQKCHREFHKIYGKGNNTAEQFVDFLTEKI